MPKSSDVGKPPRERLLRAASLFYTEGIRAVGVNRILEAANTPIMSLYRLFGSKDGLVEAFLVDKDQRVQAVFEREVDRRASTGREKALAVFDVLAMVIADPGYRGCTFINVAVEMADPEHPFVAVSKAHKQSTRECFAGYLREAGVKNTGALAAQLLMLMDGVFVAAQMQAPYDAVAHAKDVAATLIDKALAEQTPRSKRVPAAKMSA